MKSEVASVWRQVAFSSKPPFMRVPSYATLTPRQTPNSKVCLSLITVFLLRSLSRTLPQHLLTTRRNPPLLKGGSTIAPQAGILKAGAVGIECPLKAKHVLVPVMVGAAAVQRFSLSSVLSSSRS